MLNFVQTLFSGPGPQDPFFQTRGSSKQVGEVFECIWNVFATKLHVEMVETIVQSIETKHFGIFNIFGGSCASPSGKHICEIV